MNIKELNRMPRMFGEVFYPGGVPLTPDMISIDDQNVQEIALKPEQKLTEEEQSILKEYAWYKINAPMFTSDFTNELRRMDFQDMTLSEVVVACLAYGIDPY